MAIGTTQDGVSGEFVHILKISFCAFLLIYVT